VNIIIIGGTRGIGKELVLFLAQDIGNQIFVTGRDQKSLKNLARLHKNVSYLALDISRFDSQVELFRKIVTEKFSGVDILVNVAGTMISKDFEEITSAEARSIMEVNFIAPASVIRVLKPLMNKGSHIVNISSMGGFQGSSKYRGLSYYSASKAALACLSECLATEFADSGISVNCLALGAVQTEMLEEAFPGYKAPVKADEIAEYIGDFALRGHRFINGKIIPVALSNP